MKQTRSNQAPDGDVRLTLNVRAEIQQKLKVASAMTRVTMGELVEQLVAEKLDGILRAGVKA